ncbi:hypothetical protein BDW74DRAFT_184133 [Aspergillus multicolor]|uniref:DUF3237 domain-containing protein n=1 Tax=Aspergillus multicolor TaxID=41759 RepID=UPI003CCD2306
MAEFPALKPAFTINIEIDAPLAVGTGVRQTSLQIIPFSKGVFKTQESFEPAFEAQVVGTGNDYIHVDPDGKHMRLNANGVLKTQDDALLYVNYTGVITITEAEQKVLSGTADEGSTPWGNSFTHVTFETGDDRYKDLENRVFVSKGRFNVQKGKPTVVEYRVSQVVQG